MEEENYISKIILYFINSNKDNKNKNSNDLFVLEKIYKIAFTYFWTASNGSYIPNYLEETENINSIIKEDENSDKSYTSFDYENEIKIKIIFVRMMAKITIKIRI